MSSGSKRCAVSWVLLAVGSTNGCIIRCPRGRKKTNGCSSSFVLLGRLAEASTAVLAFSKTSRKQVSTSVKNEWLELPFVPGGDSRHGMRTNQIRAVRGYKRPKPKGGAAASIAPNRLNQQFTFSRANEAWVTDITYIRTWEGWLYLAVVIDLYSRKVVGWSMKATLAREVVLDALLMAVWKRKPKEEVIVHSDQGSQYGSDVWVRFCRAHNLTPSMSRRGNCHDNAVAESFFSSLKKEQVRKKIYRTRDDARADLFHYIEVFYNRRRRHSHIGGVSPEAFEEAAAKAV